jgi:hypothetical protein
MMLEGVGQLPELHASEVTSCECTAERKIQQLLPSGAVAVESSDVEIGQQNLVPQELTVLARCVEKRRREFIAG